MKEFEYHAPQSLEEALSLLERYPEARALAGGTDLVVQMKYGRVEPPVLIDVKKVPELNRLEADENRGLFVGAAVSVLQLLSFSPAPSGWPLLCEACGLIGSFQLRHRATLGGNICNAAPSADSAPPLLCLDGRAHVAGREGVREIPLHDFFIAPGKTRLAPGELLLGIEIPPCPHLSAGAYLRHIPRQDMDIAVVGAASFLVFDEKGQCGQARIALGAVAPTPIRATDAESLLEGKMPTAQLFDEAAAAAAAQAEPISDVRGSASYRREIVGVLVRRTLDKALDTYRAKNGEAP